MRCLPIALAFATAAACTAEPPPPPPFQSTTSHYRVDDILLPSTSDLVTSFGSDLDGDGQVDNQIGGLIDGLAAANDIYTDAQIRALIGSGAIASEVSITYGNATASMRYSAELGDDPPAIAGTLGSDGDVFAADLTPGATDLVLPVFAGLAPSTLYLDYAQFELAADGSGAGYIARIQGLADPSATLVAACTGIEDLIASDPASHTELEQEFGSSYDACSSTTSLFLTPDSLYDGAPYYSFGFAVHLTPED